MTRTYTDPITGDPLTLGERVSWALQAIIRRWTFFVAYNAFTAFAWWQGAFLRQDLTTQWNLIASWLAIVIEFLVGYAMLRQTRRDALILREVRDLAQRQIPIMTAIETLVEREEREILKEESLLISQHGEHRQLHTANYAMLRALCAHLDIPLPIEGENNGNR